MTSNLALIERAIAFASRRYPLGRDEVEEFSSRVKLRLIENDYRILRAYEGRCKFSTFIETVVQRMALDYLDHLWGKWHASEEAKRLGDVAIELEELLHRDGRTFDDAVLILGRKHAGATRESLEAIAARLPVRGPRRHEVAIDDAVTLAGSGGESVEKRVISREQQATAAGVSAVIAEAIAQVPEDERLLFQLHFEGGMTIAQIARALQRDQRELYGIKERQMRYFKAALLRAGFSRDVLDLVGSDEVNLDFKIGKPPARPSKSADETLGGNSEAPQ